MYEQYEELKRIIREKMILKTEAKVIMYKCLDQKDYDKTLVSIFDLVWSGNFDEISELDLINLSKAFEDYINKNPENIPENKIVKSIVFVDSSKYVDPFIQFNKKNNASSIVSKIVVQENSYNFSCTEWNNTQVEEFLKSLKLESIPSMAMSFNVLKKFISFVAKEENKKVNDIKVSAYNSLIDMEAVKRVTINQEQYDHIRHQFKLNIRDKLLLEFSWECLMFKEIQNLKIIDIVFTANSVLIKRNNKIDLEIKDMEIIEDIKKCIDEKFYYIKPVRNANGNWKNDSADYAKVTKIMKLKDTPYLIKPVLVGRGRAETIYDPNVSLNKSMFNENITCSNIDVFGLSLENIKRSKYIWLLSSHNPQWDIERIMVELDTGNNRSILNGYKWMAKQIYK